MHPKECPALVRSIRRLFIQNDALKQPVPMFHPDLEGMFDQLEAVHADAVRAGPQGRSRIAVTFAETGGLLTLASVLYSYSKFLVMKPTYTIVNTLELNAYMCLALALLYVGWPISAVLSLVLIYLLSFWYSPSGASRSFSELCELFVFGVAMSMFYSYSSPFSAIGLIFVASVLHCWSGFKKRQQHAKQHYTTVTMCLAAFNTLSALFYTDRQLAVQFESFSRVDQVIDLACEVFCKSEQYWAAREVPAYEARSSALNFLSALLPGSRTTNHLITNKRFISELARCFSSSESSEFISSPTSSIVALPYGTKPSTPVSDFLCSGYTVLQQLADAACVRMVDTWDARERAHCRHCLLVLEACATQHFFVATEQAHEEYIKEDTRCGMAALARSFLFTYARIIADSEVTARAGPELVVRAQRVMEQLRLFGVGGEQIWEDFAQRFPEPERSIFVRVSSSQPFMDDPMIPESTSFFPEMDATNFSQQQQQQQQHSQHSQQQQQQQHHQQQRLGKKDRRKEKKEAKERERREREAMARERQQRKAGAAEAQEKERAKRSAAAAAEAQREEEVRKLVMGTDIENQPEIQKEKESVCVAGTAVEQKLQQPDAVSPATVTQQLQHHEQSRPNSPRVHKQHSPIHQHQQQEQQMSPSQVEAKAEKTDTNAEEVAAEQADSNASVQTVRVCPCCCQHAASLASSDNTLSASTSSISSLASSDQSSDTQNAEPHTHKHRHTHTHYAPIMVFPELPSIRRVCNTCGKEGEGVHLRRCGACARVRYCSRECQVRDWPEHKKTCVPLFEAA